MHLRDGSPSPYAALESLRGEQRKASTSAGFAVFSDPTAENRFGRAPVQCRGCPPAIGSGQSPSNWAQCPSRRRAAPESTYPPRGVKSASLRISGGPVKPVAERDAPPRPGNALSTRSVYGASNPL